MLFHGKASQGKDSVSPFERSWFYYFMLKDRNATGILSSLHSQQRKEFGGIIN